MRDEEKEQRVRPGWPRPALGALSGVLAGFASLAVAEPVAAAVRPQPSPIIAVGGASIDATPAAVKDRAIRHFGTHDKFLLQLDILPVPAVPALVPGALAVWFGRVGAAGVLLFGVIGAAVSRPGFSSITDAFLSVVGAVAGLLLLYALMGHLIAVRRPASPALDSAAQDARDGMPVPTGGDGRGFVLAVTSVAAASAEVGAIGRSVNTSLGQDAIVSRKKVVPPPPGSPAQPVPRRAGLRVPGIASFATLNSDFHRVDTAPVVPKADAASWRPRIHGKGVRRPGIYSFDDLQLRKLSERDITLTCVSDEVGGPYGGRRLLDRRTAGRPARRMRGRTSVPGRAGGPHGVPVGGRHDDRQPGRGRHGRTGRDAGPLGMNGEPLSSEHGFPVRTVVPGLYWFVSTCKWIKAIDLNMFHSYAPYWGRRGWARRAAIKTASRIHTPKPFARPKAGTVMIAGSPGPGTGQRQGRGPHRRPLTRSRSGRREHTRHLAAVVASLAGHQGRPHPHRPCHQPHRRCADRQTHPHRPRRRSGQRSVVVAAE